MTSFWPWYVSWPRKMLNPIGVYSSMDLELVPKVGQKAPDFELPDDMGHMVRLSDIVRDGTVLLMFYPTDFGPVCSLQMGELRDRYQEFEAALVRILPVSTNGVRSHAAWRESMHLPFSLLADEDGKVTELYHMDCDDEAWLKNLSCRGAFVLDREMKVRYRWIPPNPHTTPNVSELLREARSVT
jgi:peroxiredoxin